MALAIALVFVGAFLIFWPASSLTGITQVILMTVGAVVLLIAAVGIIVAKLYQRASANEALSLIHISEPTRPY